MKTLNILIVDRETTAAKTLARDLKHYQHQVLGIASSGKEAIDRVAKNLPDLIIVEIMLAGEMDGITTSQKIQTDYQIPIIYLTTCRDRTTIRRARATKPKGYLIKPYKRKDLQATIQDAFPDANPLQSKIKKIQRKAKLATYKVKQIAHQNLHLPSFSDRDRQIIKEQHRQHLATLSPQDSQIVARLNQEGVYITSLTDLQLPHTKRLIKELKILQPHLYTLVPDRNWREGIKSHRKFFHREILLWSLGERLLDIIENYIGLPLLFHGADLRRDIADAPLTDARHWHLDIDDERIIKVIIYLNNVSKFNGPFEYIPRSLTQKIVDRFGYKSGFITDEMMAKVVPSQQWKTCTATAGSIIIADPCNIFHRAKPAKKNRYSITFGYTSIIPKIRLSQFQLSPQELQKITPHLSQRQLACLGQNN